MDRMFRRCLDDGKYKQAAGIAFETRRIDVLKEAIIRSVSGIRRTFKYTFSSD